MLDPGDESSNMPNQVSPEVLVNESNSGNEDIGESKTWNGETYIYVKGTQFTRFSNFLMSIEHHGILEDNSEAYILSCMMKDMSVFTVPLNLSDLDSFGKLYSKLQKYRPGNTVIMIDIGRRGKVHCFLDSLIRKYRSFGEKKEVLLVERCGFHENHHGLSTFFVLGPKQAIPTSKNDELSMPDVIWIGPKSGKNCQVGPHLQTDDIIEILDQLKEYHGVNFGSILLMLAFTKLSVHRYQLLEQNGIHFPSLHVIGDIATGKSHAAEHLRCFLPFVETQNGLFHLKRDDSPTESVVYKELSSAGSPLIYDPALTFPASTMNSLSDNTYQGVLHRTKYTSGEALKVQRGLIQVHAHENASLPGLLPTALSKSVISLHERQEDINLEMMEKIHQNLVKQFKAISGVFRLMVLPLDQAGFTDDKGEYISRLTNTLSVDYSEKLVSSSSRAIDNHALIMVGWKQLAKDMELPYELSVQLQSCLYNFISRKCLPSALNAIQIATPKKSTPFQAFSQESLINELTQTMSNLSFREFFQAVFISKTSLHLSRDTFLKSTSPKLREVQLLLEGKFNLNRCFFLSPDSTPDWFKRSRTKLDARDSYCIYGKCTKKYAYTMDGSKIWPELMTVLCAKSREAVPEIEITTPLKDIYKALYAHFDSLHLNASNEVREEHEEDGVAEKMLGDLYSSLSKDQQKEFLKGAEELHRRLASQELGRTRMTDVTHDLGLPDEPRPGAVRLVQDETLLLTESDQDYIGAAKSAQEVSHPKEGSGSANERPFGFDQNQPDQQTDSGQVDGLDEQEQDDEDEENVDKRKRVDISMQEDESPEGATRVSRMTTRLRRKLAEKNDSCAEKKQKKK